MTTTGPGTVEITEVAPADPAALARYAAVKEAVRRADAPWQHPVTAWNLAGALTHGWDGHPPVGLLMSADGADVAVADYEAPRWDNTHAAWVNLAVHPDRRRDGHGTALLGHVVDRARREGKTLLGATGGDTAAARAFAERHGFELGMVSVHRRLEVDGLDRAALERVRAEAAAHATAYELVHRAGPAPASELAALARMTEAINDAPQDGLDLEDEAYPPERVAAYERAWVERGQRLHRVLARHRATGELAGHTVVVVESQRPEVAHQHDTSVVAGHRGHRLGVLLKAEMLVRLADLEPQVRTVDTWNAETNEAMVAVNDALGYVPLARALMFQRGL